MNIISDVKNRNGGKSQDSDIYIKAVDTIKDMNYKKETSYSPKEIIHKILEKEKEDDSISCPKSVKDSRDVNSFDKNKNKNEKDIINKNSSLSVDKSLNSINSKIEKENEDNIEENLN